MSGNGAPDCRHAGPQERRMSTTTTWTFLTNHAAVLLCIAEDPGMRARDIAAKAGITERGVGRIISQLEEAGYLSHERVGRRNHYRVHPDLPLRRSIQGDQPVWALLTLLGPRCASPPPTARAFAVSA